MKVRELVSGRNRSRLIFVLLGAAAGYAYYHFIGCATGTCPISSNPYISTLYGGLMGFTLGMVREEN